MSEIPKTICEERIQFGQKLREARLSVGLSDEDLIHQTRISPQFIEALEKGEFENLPGRIFGRGFVVSIAKAIGGESSEFVEAYDQCWSDPAVIPPMFKKQVKQCRKTRGKLWLTFAVIVLGSIFTYMFIERGSISFKDEALSTSSQNTDRREVEVESTKSLDPNPLYSPQGSHIEAPLGSQHSLPDASVPEKLSLSIMNQREVVLQVHKTTAVRISIDQQGVANRNLEIGEHRFEFQGQMELVVHDISAMTVAFAGEVLNFGEGKKRQHLVFSHGADWKILPGS